ncbi:MAG: heme ABC transporter permease [Bdellovibrionales bacterium]
MKSLALLANPTRCARLAAKLTPFAALGATVTFVWGLALALFASPADYQQGETVRIMYVHVPAAWTGMMIYGAMALAAGISLVTRAAIMDIICVAAAPVGATFVALCLATGCLWGKPTWGAWWVWDARLTSVLILFLLYCGYMALRNAFDDETQGAKAGAWLLLAGAINLPIIKFSVDWWNTLHQPTSVLRSAGSAIAPAMLRPLLVMALAFTLYAAWLVMLRVQTIVARRRMEKTMLNARA